MGSLKEQLYQEVANRSLNKVRSEFRDKHKLKKDGRFMVKTITYELGIARCSENGIFFEVSSKIPFEQLPPRSSKEKYFRLVKDIVLKGEKLPLSVEMESIVTKARDNEQERKEREYVKMEYEYSDDELFDPKKIEKEMEACRKGEREIPVIPGVNSLYGKLVIDCVEKSVYKKAKGNINFLIKANDQVLKLYKKK